MCLFCDIINKEIPSKVVYEDDDVLAILDISQTTYGHTLVMPKQHYANLKEVDKETLDKVINVVQDLAKKITTACGANGFNILNNCGEVAGQTVDHLHFHIIPRYDENDTVQFGFKTNEFDLDEVLAKING